MIRVVTVPLGILAVLLGFAVALAAWPNFLESHFVPPATLEQVEFIHRRGSSLSLTLLLAFVVLCALARRVDPFSTRTWISSGPAAFLIAGGVSLYLLNTERQALADLVSGPPDPTRIAALWLALSAFAVVALFQLVGRADSRPRAYRRR